VPAVEIQGAAAPGQSTGQAMAAMEHLAQKLPAGIGYEWTGISLQQIQAGTQAPYFYALSVIVVFLASPPSTKAGRSRSRSPGGALACWARSPRPPRSACRTTSTSRSAPHHDRLSAKNAILIVEFARELHAQGRSVIEAAIEAAHMRLRPIVMTSLPSDWAFCRSRSPGARARQPARHRHRRAGGVLSAPSSRFPDTDSNAVVSTRLSKDKVIRQEAVA